MKQLHGFLFLIMFASFANADWRIEAFDEAQSLFVSERNEQKAIILEKYPNLREWYETHTDVLWRYRNRLNRMAFLYLLETSPSEINWESVHWYMDYRFAEKERESRYIRFIPGYRELRDQIYKHNWNIRKRSHWAVETQMQDIQAREELSPLLLEVYNKYKKRWKELHARVKRLGANQDSGVVSDGPKDSP